MFSRKVTLCPSLYQVTSGEPRGSPFAALWQTKFSDWLSDTEFGALIFTDSGSVTEETQTPINPTHLMNERLLKLIQYIYHALLQNERAFV